jgi:two-component system sensor histidine kinase BarA
LTQASTSALIDWPKTLKRYKNEKFARSLLLLFSKDLYDFQTKIKQHYKNNHLLRLERIIHKIHGACCFCVSPQLEVYSNKLQAKLAQKDYSSLEEHLDKLDALITRVLKAIQPYIKK